MRTPTECDSLTDTQLIELMAEDVQYLKCVSYRTRDYCLRFMQRVCNGSVDAEQLKDIYHDALIVLYEKAKGGQFTLTCSIQTYLNSICRNNLLSLLKSISKISSLDAAPAAGGDGAHSDFLTGINDWLHTGDNAINNDRMQAIMSSLEAMKGRGDCYELLQLVHYHDKSMKDVALHFGYRNEQIARNKNYLCREKLRALTLQALKKLK